MTYVLSNLRINTLLYRSGSSLLATGQRRNLNVHEHVSYTLLKKNGIPVPNFAVTNKVEEAGKIAEQLKTRDMVVKAQVLAGGRGKGHFKQGLIGGVRMCSTPEEVRQTARLMLGDYLITKQTGQAGKKCSKIMITERKFPRREFYIAIMLERAFGGPVIIASSQGGVNIEEVAKTNPKAIVYFPIDILKGLSKEDALLVVGKIGLNDAKEETAQLLLNMYKMFIQYDAQLVELNPYAEDSSGKYFALDAKLRFDNNAEFRQKEVFSYRDLTQEEPKEVKAKQYGLNYISLDGTIGCLVNGAGLAMAMMDVITSYGESPANFLDVGGGASIVAVKEAFQIIMSDEKVCCILVNIFGGIMRCDIIAEGIINATKTLKVKVPIVCRLLGNNVDDAKLLIRESGMEIIFCNNLDEAAKLVVKLARIIKIARSTRLRVQFEIPPLA